ncbi:o-succinylbenzoate synthase [Lysinibacillus sp. 2017]|uniref:o-succinylbenzoate synthase n=1 Tax=unclassified Lysinibacillus TaxID=2636778 RepID=UPI000D529D3E|nr:MULTISPECIES: o-succinylbenzoate synthase [unclassified Lysinibacillus]AWE08963.1 o-succinylbenzoate synthase [Lysinibacillus sp. 2017]TGN35527.1 o-succinylbenzoate synthase [Lysinibacillus sp. S2017]
MKLVEVIIHQVEMRMKTPFTTSLGSMQTKRFLVIEAKDETGVVGWGEGVAFEDPSYTEETLKTTLHMLEDFLIPKLLGHEIKHPDEVYELFRPIRRNNMAKAAIEGAVWGIFAQHTNQSLAKAIGGTRSKIEVGISIGLQPTDEQLIHTIQSFLDQGYKRIKVKIKPGKDIELLRTIRKAFPYVPLMADANSSYTLHDLELLKKLDEFNLMMIEQPLAHDDLIDHAALQKAIQTPICLDESITSLDDTRKAIQLGSCGVINIKIARVGGISEAKRIHDYCAEHNIAVWCGGMLEAGIGRAQNVALTSLANFTMPGDTAASERYWYEDLITPEVTVEDGYINVPKKVGLGYEVNRKALEKYSVQQKTYRL